MHKKRAYRLKIPLKMGVFGEEKEGLQFSEQCSTMNVGPGGACLVSRHHLTPGSIIILSVAGQIEGKAVVVWSERGVDEIPHKAGIKFLEMSEWIVK